MTISELRQARAEALDAAKQILATAKAEEREVTDEEFEQVEGYKAKADEHQTAIERAEKREQLAQTIEHDHHTLSQQVNRSPDVTAGRDNAADDPKWGWKYFSEFMGAVRQAELGRYIDPRLTTNNPAIRAASATTYGNEAIGQDGGYLIPPEFSQEVRTLSLGEDSILPLTDRFTLSGNSLTFPRDETTPWGTNGVRAYWEAEGSAATQTKPLLAQDTVRMHKLMSLVPLTDELLEDTTVVGTYVSRLMGRSIRWKMNEALIDGTGVGQPLGATVSGAAVTEARDAANAVSASDVATMFSRLPNSESMSRAVWMIHPSVLPEIMTMTISNQPIWTPPNEGFKQAPGGMLLGLPVMISQHCAALGTEGDVKLMDWQWYVAIEKAGGIEFAQSIHLFFDAAQTAFRAVFRIGGQPWLNSEITQNNGSATLSPFIELTDAT